MDTTDATTVIPFPNDIAVGDTFAFATCGVAWLAGVQLTTLLDEVNASGDNQSGDNLRVVEGNFNDEGLDGRNTSSMLLSIFDHLFASGGSV